MNPDEFEKRLQRQPLRQIPSEWREKILQGATRARLSTLDSRPSFLSTILWPHPKAWAALAASWIVIMTLQLASSDHTNQVAKKSGRPSPESVAVLQQQTRLLAELFGQLPPRDADRPKPNASQPRSERRTKTMIA